MGSGDGGGGEGGGGDGSGGKSLLSEERSAVPDFDSCSALVAATYARSSATHLWLEKGGVAD